MSWILIGGAFKLKEYYISYVDLDEEVILMHSSCNSPVAEIEALSLVEIINLIEEHKCSEGVD